MLALYRTLSLRYLRLRWGLNALVVLSIAPGRQRLGRHQRPLLRAWNSRSWSASTRWRASPTCMVSNGDAGVPRDLDKRLAAVPGVKSVRPIVIEFGARRPRRQQPARRDAARHGAAARRRERLRPAATSRSARSTDRGLPGPAATATAAGRRRPAGWRRCCRRDAARLRLMLAGRHPRGHARRHHRGERPHRGPGRQRAADGVRPAAAKLLDRPGRVSRFDIVLAPDADREAVARAIRAEVERAPTRARCGTPRGGGQPRPRGAGAAQGRHR